jgi:hypothetical protein
MDLVTFAFNEGYLFGKVDLKNRMILPVEKTDVQRITRSLAQTAE